MQGPVWDKRQQQNTQPAPSMADLFGEIIIGADFPKSAPTLPVHEKPEVRTHDPDFIDFSKQQLIPALEALRATGYRDLSALAAITDLVPGDRATYRIALDQARSAVDRAGQRESTADTQTSLDLALGYPALRPINSWVQDAGLALSVMIFPTLPGRSDEYRLRLNRILEINELSVPGGSCPVFDLKDLNQEETTVYQGFHDNEMRLSAIFPDAVRNLAAEHVKKRSIGIEVSRDIDVIREEAHRTYARLLQPHYPQEQDICDLFLQRGRLEEAFHGIDFAITRSTTEEGNIPADSTERLSLLLRTLIRSDSHYQHAFAPNPAYNRGEIYLRRQAIPELSADLSLTQTLPSPVHVSAKWVRDVTMLHKFAEFSGGRGINPDTMEGNYGLGSSIAVLMTSPTARTRSSSSFSLNDPASTALLLDYANELHTLAVQEPEDFVERCRATRAKLYQPHYDPAAASLRKVAVYSGDI